MQTSGRRLKTAGLVFLVVILSARLVARSRRGDTLLAQSRDAELRSNWDKALSLAEEALSNDSGDVAYQLATTRLRFYCSQYHLDQGKALRAQGRLEQALVEFQKAYGINPASGMAEEEVARTKVMIERDKNLPASAQNPEERGRTPAQIDSQTQQSKFAAMQPPAELRPVNSSPLTLKMHNEPPTILFETLGKLAGINVLFDPEFKAGTPIKAQSIDLNNATLYEALDYLALITRSFWKPISANAIFVTQDNPNKRREFEDWVFKAFYLKNVLTAQDLQEIVTAIRTVADIQKVFSYQAQNAIIVRAEVDKVALAEKIIADVDKPKAEVLVDVLVMQVSRTKSRDLASAVAPSGINSAITFAPRSSISTPVSSSSSSSSTSSDSTTTTTTSTTIPLSKIGKISTADYSLTLPGAQLQAVLNDSSSKVLQSPQVRAVDGMKVSLKIGDRVPYATGSYQPGTATTTVSSLVNTQFSFLDVGVNVDIVPKIHGTDEVSLHVEIDISNVKTTVDLGGINEPEVSQTKIVNDVRLKQGEVNMIGGLMQVQDTKTVSGVPGLGNIPVLRRLFTSESVTKDASELVIALIPHIVRAPDITDVNLKSVSAGNSTNVKLKYAPERVTGPDSSKISPPIPGMTLNGPAVGPLQPLDSALPPAASPRPVAQPPGGSSALQPLPE